MHRQRTREVDGPLPSSPSHGSSKGVWCRDKRAPRIPLPSLDCDVSDPLLVRLLRGNEEPRASRFPLGETRIILTDKRSKGQR